MVLSSYLLLLFSLANACEIKLYGNCNIHQSLCKEGLEKLEKKIDSKFTKNDKLLQEINTLLQKTSGMIEDCKPKYVKEQPLVNVAQGKIAHQISTHYDKSKYKASRAVDGNTSTFSHTSWQSGPSWWLDLEKEFNISRIEMFNREDCCGYYFHDVDITVGLTLNNMTTCAVYKGPAKNKEHIVFNCKTPLVGRFVKLAIKEGERSAMQIAELKVLAYKPF